YTGNLAKPSDVSGKTLAQLVSVLNLNLDNDTGSTQSNQPRGYFLSDVDGGVKSILIGAYAGDHLGDDFFKLPSIMVQVGVPSAPPTPEPSTVVLLTAGMATMVMIRRRRKSRTTTPRTSSSGRPRNASSG